MKTASLSGGPKPVQFGCVTHSPSAAALESAASTSKSVDVGSATSLSVFAAVSMVPDEGAGSELGAVEASASSGAIGGIGSGSEGPHAVSRAAVEASRIT